MDDAKSRRRAKGAASRDAALIIFAKAPIPGQVKTRLCPPLTPDEAATLHGSLVLDTLERTARVPAERYLACAPSADHVFFKIMAERHGVRLLSQPDGDLGARMLDAFRAVLPAGYRKAVLVGTDVPALSADLIGQAFSLLDRHELVLGPAVDGGYYLIGLTRVVPELFAGIPWSSEQVAGRTLERARDLGLGTGLLPRLRDLDTVDDILALAEGPPSREEGPAAPRSRSGSPAPGLSKRTGGVLRSLAERIRSRRGGGTTRVDRHNA